jgi:hypothetical protein
MLRHPKQDEVFAYAWQEGHSAGFSEVLSYLERIAEIFDYGEFGKEVS